MKKVFYVFQVFILMIFIAKIMSLCGLIQFLETPRHSFFSENRAMAESPRQAPAVKDVLDDELAQPRSLLNALQNRQKELDEREYSLRVEEQKLLSLKKEITEKIDLLLRLEQKLDTAIGADKEADAKRYRDLAKVYEATPPAKAGAMMERLDLKTAAGISMHMKREKAGAIWGYLSPQKVVDITKEITMTSQKASE
jgi:flagellar motility protein MotE (MotC chaperone)